MTISFGGLASGVDTSSWIEALVSMKQASLKTYEEKKEILVQTTSILDNVKSFFNSFKSVLSNVTNSNMGIASFDLFIQKLAETTNAEAVTANVTTEAQQASYEVNVDQIATATEAKSGFLTTITTTTESIATHNSLLSSIGIRAGEVGINVGGVERVLTLQSNDTISSLIEKLNRIGVEASYDASYGYFSVNLGVEDINDDLDGDGIDNTGIKDAFFLTNVNSGYASDLLELFSTFTNVITATESCKMSAFGVTDGEYIVTDVETNEFTTHSIDVDKTFREFFDELQLYGFDAAFNDDGSITIVTNGGKLLSGALAECLGLVTLDSSVQTSTRASSTISAFSTETINLDFTSTLGDIGAITSDNDKLLILDRNHNTIQVISTLDRDSTVDDFFNILAQYGIAGNIEGNFITLTPQAGNVIGGEIAVNMGFDTYVESITTIKAGNSTTSTSLVSYVASATDWISDCLWDVWDSYSDADKVITVSHTNRYGTDEVYTYTVIEKNSIASDGSVLRGTQFQDIMDWYNNVLDTTSTMVFNENGQIYIDSNDCFHFEGAIADYLGISTYATTYTWTEGITTTQSYDTLSFRVRKTDYIADTLWDNGWLTYTDDQKVISAYHSVVDHIDNGNGDSTFQHTVVTLVGTFTIKESQTSVLANGTTTTIVQGTTFEDLTYWYTTQIDTTATFLINNDGTITIDSDDTFKLEGQAITDLGLGVSTYHQVWTTGIEETQSSSTIQYASKMSDFVSDTFTYNEWCNVNKTISVYTTRVDHIDGSDGNGTFEVTIQQKLTDIVITTLTTFNTLADQLSAYDIELTINDGVLQLNSTKANFIVEEGFYNQAVNNVTYAAGTTSMLDHFGIQFDTVTQSWTTGITTTQSSTDVSYKARLSDYISDSFRLSEWEGNGSHGAVNKDIVIYHTYWDHSQHKTIIEETTRTTITEQTKFSDLQSFLAANSIIMTMTEGVISLDSDCYFVAGDRYTAGTATTDSANHYGEQVDTYTDLWTNGIMNHFGYLSSTFTTTFDTDRTSYDTITQTWTTGTEETSSSQGVAYLAKMTDYIADTFTVSGWNAINKTISVYSTSVDHVNGGDGNSYYQVTVQTKLTDIVIDYNTTFNQLNNSLNPYGITLDITNGVLSINSTLANYLVEDGVSPTDSTHSMLNHFGITHDVDEQNWTTGITTTQSTSDVTYKANWTDYISDSFRVSDWNNLNSTERTIVIYHTYLDHNQQRTIVEETTRTTITDQTKFSDLQIFLSPYINMTMNNGVIDMDSDCYFVAGADININSSSAKNADGSFKTGELLTHFGAYNHTITQNWTTGTTATQSSDMIYYETDSDDYIKDLYTSSEWASLSNKSLHIKYMTYDYDSHSTVIHNAGTINITDSMQISELQNTLRNNYGITLSVSNGVVTLDSTSGNWIDTSDPIAQKMGLEYNTVQLVSTYGVSSTSTDRITYTIGEATTIYDALRNEWDSLNKVLSIYQSTIGIDTTNDTGYVRNVLLDTFTVDQNTTFADLAAWANQNNNNIEITYSNGYITAFSDNDTYMTGDIAVALGISTTGGSYDNYTIGKSATSSSLSFITHIEDYVVDTEASLNGTVIRAIQENLVNGVIVQSVLGTMTIGSTTTFQQIQDFADDYGILFDSTNGIFATSTIYDDKNQATYYRYLDGAIVDVLNIGTVEDANETWTMGTTATSAGTIAVASHADDLISDILDESWNSLTDKNVYVQYQTYDVANRQATYETIATINTTGMTMAELRSQLELYCNGELDFDLDDNGELWINIPVDSDGRYFASGQVINALGTNPVDRGNYTVTVGTTVTGSQLTATLTEEALYSNYFSSDLYVRRYNPVTGSCYDSQIVNTSGSLESVFDDIKQKSNYNIGISVSDGKISYTGRNGYYLYGLGGTGLNTYDSVVSISTEGTLQGTYRTFYMSTTTVTETSTSVITKTQTQWIVGAPTINFSGAVSHMTLTESETSACSLDTGSDVQEAIAYNGRQIKLTDYSQNGKYNIEEFVAGFNQTFAFDADHFMVMELLEIGSGKYILTLDDTHGISAGDLSGLNVLSYLGFNTSSFGTGGSHSTGTFTYIDDDKIQLRHLKPDSEHLQPTYMVVDLFGPMTFPHIENWIRTDLNGESSALIGDSTTIGALKDYLGRIGLDVVFEYRSNGTWEFSITPQSPDIHITDSPGLVALGFAGDDASYHTTSVTSTTTLTPKKVWYDKAFDSYDWNNKTLEEMGFSAGFGITFKNWVYHNGNGGMTGYTDDPYEHRQFYWDSSKTFAQIAQGLDYADIGYKMEFIDSTIVISTPDGSIWEFEAASVQGPSNGNTLIFNKNYNETKIYKIYQSANYTTDKKTMTAVESTRLAELGYIDSTEVTIGVTNPEGEDEYYTYHVTANTTLRTVLAYYRTRPRMNVSINNGCMTVKTNTYDGVAQATYVANIDSNLQNLLGLGGQNLKEAVTYTRYSHDDGLGLDTGLNTYVTLDRLLGTNNSVSYEVRTHTNTVHGEYTDATTVTWNGTETLQSFMDKMTAAGINTTFDFATRTVTFKGDNDHYFQELGTVNNTTVFNPLQVTDPTYATTEYTYHRYTDTEFTNSKFSDIAPNLVGTTTKIYGQAFNPDNRTLVTSEIGSLTINNDTRILDLINFANDKGMAIYVQGTTFKIASKGNVYMTGAGADFLGASTTTEYKYWTYGVATTSNSSMAFDTKLSSKVADVVDGAVGQVLTAKRNIINYDNGTVSTTTLATFTVGSNTTYENIKDWLANYDMLMAVADGNLTITSNNYSYVENDLIVGATNTNNTMTFATPKTVESSSIIYTTATAESSMANYGLLGKSYELCYYDEITNAVTVTARFVVEEGDTFQNLFENVWGGGIEGRIENGRLYFDYHDSYFIRGDSAFGFADYVLEERTITVGASVTSGDIGVGYYVTVGSTVTSSTPLTVNATMDSKISDFGISSSNIYMYQYSALEGINICIATITTDQTTTFGELLYDIEGPSNGDISFDFVNGKAVFQCYNGIFLESDNTDWGLDGTFEHSQRTITTGVTGSTGHIYYNVDNTYSNGTVHGETLYTTSNQRATLTTSLGELGINGLTVAFKDGSIEQIGRNANISDVVHLMNHQGVHMSWNLDERSFNLQLDGDVLQDYSVLGLLGLSTDPSDYYGGYTYKHYINSDDFTNKTLADMGMSIKNNELVIYRNKDVAGTVSAGKPKTITISDTMTFEDISNALNYTNSNGSPNNIGLEVDYMGRLSFVDNSAIGVGYYINDLSNYINFLQDGSSSFEFTTGVVEEFTSCSYESYITFSKLADDNTTLQELGANTGFDIGALTNQSGGYWNVGSSNTLFNLFNRLDDCGISGSIEDGIITITTNNGNCVMNATEFGKLGLSTNTTDYKRIETIAGPIGASDSYWLAQCTAHGLSPYAIVGGDEMELTLSYLGFSGLNFTIYGKENYVENGIVKRPTYNLDYNAGMTLSEIKIDLLTNYGIEMTLSNGHITFTSQSDSDYYIEDVFANATQFGTSISGTYQTQTATANLLSSSGEGSNQFTGIAQSDTLLNEIGLDHYGAVFLCAELLDNGQTGTAVNAYTGDVTSFTIGDFINQINSKGLNASLSGGKINISGVDHAIIDVIDSETAAALNLPTTGNGYCNSVVNHIISNSGQTGLITDMKENYTLADMGITSSVSVTVNRHTNTFNCDETETTNVVWDVNQTFSSFLDELRATGLTVNYDSSTQKVTITGNNFVYMENGTALDVMNITYDSGYASWGANCTQSAVSENQHDTDVTYRTDLSIVKLKDFNISEAQSVTIAQYDNLNHTYSYETVYWNANESLSYFLNKLFDNGIDFSWSGGKLTLIGDSANYIQDISDGLAGILGFDAGDGITYNVNSIQYTKTNSTSDKKIFTIHSDNTLSDFNITNNQSIRFVCHIDDAYAENCTTENGHSITGTNKTVVVTWSTAQSFESFLNDLNHSEAAQSFGCTFSYDANSGKVTFCGSDTAYIESIDSDLENLLRLSGVTYYQTDSYSLICEADSDKNDLKTYINNKTTLDDLHIYSEQTVNIVCHINNTYVADRTDPCTTTLSVTWTLTDTFEQFKNKVNGAISGANAGYSGTGPYVMDIDLDTSTRKVTFTGNEFTYVESMGTNNIVGQQLKLNTKDGTTYGTHYTYTLVNRADSDNNTEYIYQNTRNTKLSNFTINSDQTIYYVVHTNNTFVQRDTDPIQTYTLGIAWTTGETLGAYIDKVNTELNRLYNRIGVPNDINGTYNVSFSVDQNTGKISFTGNEFTYIDHIDSALENAWHVSENSTGTYGTNKKINNSTNYDYDIIYRPDADQNPEYTYISMRNTTLENLGIYSNQYIDIVLHTNNTYSQSCTKATDEDVSHTIRVTWTYGALGTSDNDAKPETLGEFWADINASLRAATTEFADQNLQDVFKLTAYIDNDGQFHFTGNEFTYVSDISNNLASVMHLDSQTKEDGTYGTSYDYNWIYRADADENAEYTFLNKRNTKLENWTINSDQTIYYVVHTHNTFVQDFTEQTFDEATLASNHGGDHDGDDLFLYDNNQRNQNVNNNLSTAPVHTYTIGIAWTRSETLQQYEDKVHTVLSALYTSINALRTSEPLNINSVYDITFTVDAENGKLSFSGNEYTYIDHIGNEVGAGVTGSAATDGSALHSVNVSGAGSGVTSSSVVYNGGVKNENITNTQSVLENELHIQENSTGTYGKSYSYNINYRPDSDTVQEKTYLNLRNTTLANLSIFSDQTVDIVLHVNNTYAQDTTKSTIDQLRTSGNGTVYSTTTIGATQVSATSIRYGAYNENSFSHSTTLGDLGLSNASFTLGNGQTINLNAHDSIAQVFENAGLGVSIYNDRIAISGDAGHYITSMSNNLQNALKIHVGENYTYTYRVDATVDQGDLSKVTRTITVTWTYSALDTSVDRTNSDPLKPETFGEFVADIYRSLQAETTRYADQNLDVNFGFSIGTDMNGIVDLIGNQNSSSGTSDSLNLLREDGTLDETKLMNFINLDGALDGDGYLRFRGNEFTYIQGFSNELASKLQLDTVTKENGTYGTSYEYDIDYANNSNNVTQYTYVNYDKTRLQDFDLKETQYVTIVTNNNSTFSADTTKNGTVLIDNTSSTYVIEWTLGSTGHTKNENGTYNNNDNGIYDGETFDEFIYELEHFGIVHNLSTAASEVLGNDIYKINVTINPDKTISLVGNEYTYIVGISDDLKEKFKIENYHTEDQVLTAENGTFLTETTKLSELGLSNETFTMNDGRVINISANDSIVSKLRGAGLNVSISDNTIVIDGNSGCFIKEVSTALNDALNFKIGEGYFYSTYDYNLYFTGARKNEQYSAEYNTQNHDIEFTTYKDKDGFDDPNGAVYTDQVNLTILNYDTRLDNLSILSNMTMTLETPEGGKSIEIDHDETIQQLKERLFSDYGIEVSIDKKGGLLTFTPTRADEGYYIVGIDTEFKDKFFIITGEDGTYSLNSEYSYETSTPGVYATAYHTVTAEHGTYATSTMDNYANSNSRSLDYVDDHLTTKLSTRLSKINGYNNGDGRLVVHYADGYEQDINLKSSMTIGQLCEVLADYGVTAEVLAGGRITLSSDDGTYLKSVDGGSNLLEMLNMSDFTIKVEGNTTQTSKTLSQTVETTTTYYASEDTLLSEYADGLLEANGVITFILNDRYKSVTITSDDTFGSLIAKFNEKGLKSKIQAGIFSVSSGFDTFSIVEEATTSNIAAILKFGERQDLGGYAMTDRSKTVISRTTLAETRDISVSNYADDNTKFETFNIIAGSLSVYKDGQKALVQISGSDTAKTLQDKLRRAYGQDVNGNDENNICVKYIDGAMKIYQTNTNVMVGSNEDSSNFSAITGIISNEYSANNVLDEKTTNLEALNIVGGTTSIYKDGQRVSIQVSESDTAKTLQDKLRRAYGQDVDGSDDENICVKYIDGKMKIYQNNSTLNVGDNNDSSNLANVVSMMSSESVASSTRKFYKVNEDSVITESGLFRNGDVDTGSFVIGDATINITETTTIKDVLNQINTNPDSNVTAYWDSIDGEFIVKSKTTGNFYINVEAKDTNFTDILGLTSSVFDQDNVASASTINIDAQRNGKNARVTINGATFTSVSNTLGSDVTGIEGLTLNIKNMTADAPTIITVKKDVQSLALAVSDVIDAYNELIDNINAALMSKSQLQNDSDLKRLRNQIKSIMTSSFKNSSPFKNIVSVGIVTNAADPTNLTVGSGIYKLSLDVEKFAQAFEADSEGVRTFLIGKVDENGDLIEDGILTKIEALIDEALDSANGYFERTEDSFDKQMERIDNKIVKGNQAIEKYREKLEKKYMSMNILNSNIQTQYQVYFS